MAPGLEHEFFDTGDAFVSWCNAAGGINGRQIEFKDYDHKYVFGEGGHSGNHGGAIFPDALRWLWRDYQKDGNK